MSSPTFVLTGPVKCDLEVSEPFFVPTCVAVEDCRYGSSPTRGADPADSLWREISCVDDGAADFATKLDGPELYVVGDGVNMDELGEPKSLDVVLSTSYEEV